MDGDYIPIGDGAFMQWMNNFAAKFEENAAQLGFTPTEVAAVNDDAAAVSYCMNAVAAYKAESKEHVAFKEMMLNAGAGTPVPVYPLPPSVPEPTVKVSAGIIARVRVLANRIKAHPAYAESVGLDLGIVGGNPGGAGLPVVGVKPRFTAVMSGGAVILRFTKRGYDGVVLQTKRGADPDWTLLATLLYSPWHDDRPVEAVGGAEVRHYRARYLKKNAPSATLATRFRWRFRRVAGSPRRAAKRGRGTLKA